MTAAELNVAHNRPSVAVIVMIKKFASRLSKLKVDNNAAQLCSLKIHTKLLSPAPSPVPQPTYFC